MTINGSSPSSCPISPRVPSSPRVPASPRVLVSRGSSNNLIKDQKKFSALLIGVIFGCLIYLTVSFDGDGVVASLANAASRRALSMFSSTSDHDSVIGNVVRRLGRVPSQKKSRPVPSRNCSNASMWTPVFNLTIVAGPRNGTADEESRLRDVFSKFELVADIDNDPNPWSDLAELQGASSTECAEACLAKSDCTSFVQHSGKCWLKKTVHFQPNNVPGAVTFRRLPSASGRSTDSPGSIIPSHRDQRTLYAVIASTHTLSRLRTSMRTWMQSIPGAIVFLERHRNQTADEAVLTKAMQALFKQYPQHRAVYLGEPTQTNERKFNGAWKNQAILRYIHHNKLAAAYDFLVFVDDDTFVVTHNIQIVLDWYRHSTAPFIAGRLIYSFDKVVFPHGGAGTILNRAAMQLLGTALSNRSSLCNHMFDKWGDLRITRCAQLLDIQLIGAAGMHFDGLHFMFHPKLEVGRSYPFPLTFHREPPQMMLRVHEELSMLEYAPYDPVEWVDMYDIYARLWHRHIAFRSNQLVSFPDPIDAPLPFVHKRISWEEFAAGTLEPRCDRV